MTTFLSAEIKRFPDPHQDHFSKVTLGFWSYLMTDCVLFATLFFVYRVLHTQTFGGPGPQELFSLSTSFAETMLLLSSSFACGFGMLAAQKNRKNELIGWFALTFILGLSFIILEIREFHSLIADGHSWEKSAFLSSFFTLVGTHGLHVSIGLFWLIILFCQLYVKGITTTTFRRLVCFNMFWHFLDLVWIFIFSFVYLMGIMK